MLRRGIKSGIAAALHRSGVDGWFGARTGARDLPLVIGYHRVVEDFRAGAARSIPPSLISTRTLERHLDWIGRRFDLITLDDLAAGLEGSRRFTKPVAAITFDDGYSDTYHQAFPILKRKGIPAAVFVVSDLVSTPHLQTHDRLYLLLAAVYSQRRAPGSRLLDLLAGLDIPATVRTALRRAAGAFAALRVLLETLPRAAVQRIAEVLGTDVELPVEAVTELRALTWEMLDEMTQAGITVGSHTKTHALLGAERWQTALEEAEGSRRVLEQNLGTTVAHFAYPDGSFNNAAVSAVAAAGYRSAYTTCLHRDVRYPRLTIPRRLLWEHSCMGAFGHFSSAMMGCHANAVSGFATPCRKHHGP